MTVGLLGGSFNPAHDGHLFISQSALRHLGVDQVWWLVSPQNPLKPTKGMAPLQKRVTQAKKVAQHPKIHVSALETRIRTRYTADTLRLLKKRYPHIRFIWIMGADNLAGFHRWKEWQSIMRTCGIVIFHRPSYSLRALSSRAAQRFRRFKVSHRKARTLKQRTPPAWTFHPIRGQAVSATDIRKGQPGWLKDR